MSWQDFEIEAFGAVVALGFVGVLLVAAGFLAVVAVVVLSGGWL